MITLPPKVARGDEVTASWANRVIDCLSSLRPMAGAGTRISQTPGGFMVSTLDQATAIEFNPFDISEQISDTGEIKLTLWPGSVNGVMPENMFDDFSVDSQSLWNVKATVDTDGSAVTTVTLNVDNSPPDVQQAASNALPSSFDIILGVYKDGMIYNIAGGNITLSPTMTFNNGYWAIS